MALTAKEVESKKTPGRYHDGAGLFLQITKTGCKSWIFRYERNGRQRALGLGPVRLVSLREAREKAQAAHRQLFEGIDPVAERQSDKSARRADAIRRKAEAATRMTFAQAAERYHTLKAHEWRADKYVKNFLATLVTYAFPLIGELPVADVEQKHVLTILEPIWLSRTVTAKRVRSRIEAVLDWASAAGHRSGENPARWKGNLQQLLPEPGKIARVKHHPALPHEKIGHLMAELSGREAIAARALEFAIMTAARTGEVIGATWAEIDLERRLWVIPAERMKAHKEHRVPLPDRALDLLRALPRETDNPFVFIGPKAGAGLSNMAMAVLVKRMGQRDITVHGFRSSFRDWAAERTRFENHIVEMCLAHSVGTAVERAYRRTDLLDRRRALMEQWAEYCLTPRSGEVVVQMRRAAQ